MPTPQFGALSGLFEERMGAVAGRSSWLLRVRTLPHPGNRSSSSQPRARHSWLGTSLPTPQSWALGREQLRAGKPWGLQVRVVRREATRSGEATAHGSHALPCSSRDGVVVWSSLGPGCLGGTGPSGHMGSARPRSIQQCRLWLF